MALWKCIALLCPFLFFAQIWLFPRECLKENVKITFPKSALQSNDSNQNTGVAEAVYKIIYIYIHIYIMERKQERPVDDFPTRGDALKTYFDKLATLLRNKDYSVCAWEVVRKELLLIYNESPFICLCENNCL
uniref:Uncharacterized protein n=1 Tax=Cyprinus carpio TaxID=7962 RepID=A0A8C1TI36_CYPCA